MNIRIPAIAALALAVAPVAAGANTKLADRSGATPLQLAEVRGYRAMVDILSKAR